VSATREYYRAEPILTIVGGADWDYQITIERVASTTLEGKITDLIRLGPFDLTGYTEFVGQLRSFDGLQSVSAQITLDGTGDEGTIRVRGTGRDSWALQEAGLRAGRLTIRAKAPSGGRFRIVPARWNLEVGSTSPLAGV
jgi:hypothetical protein